MIIYQPPWVSKPLAAGSYHADGLRHKTTRMGVMGSTESGSETTFLWDGSNIVAELNGNTVTSRYVRGIGLIMTDGAAGQKFYLYNGHGDVVQLANNSGNIVKTYDYDAFGNERNPDTADTNPFRYCAEYFDKETGNIYLRARYYSPVLGRFRTEDPIRDGANWYAYCHNNPMDYIDPTGLVDVGLRDYVKKTYGITDNDIVWDAKTRGATVTYNGISHTFFGNINSGGTMRIDDNIILNIFGSPTAPSFLTTIHYTVPSMFLR